MGENLSHNLKTCQLKGGTSTLQFPWVRLSKAIGIIDMTPKRILRHVRCGDFRGYQDTEDKRGKGGGVWWIDLSSVIEYHEHQCGHDKIKAAVRAVIKLVVL